MVDLNNGPMMSTQYPPKVPGNKQDIERVVMLLGSRAKGMELTPARRKELEELIGVYPGPKRAAAYKSALKALRKTLP